MSCFSKKCHGKIMGVAYAGEVFEMKGQMQLRQEVVGLMAYSLPPVSPTSMKLKSGKRGGADR